MIAGPLFSLCLLQITRRLREREEAVGSYRSEMDHGLHATDREIGDLSDRVSATRTVRETHLRYFMLDVYCFVCLRIP